MARRFDFSHHHGTAQHAARRFQFATVGEAWARAKTVSTEQASFTSLTPYPRVLNYKLGLGGWVRQHINISEDGGRRRRGEEIRRPGRARRQRLRTPPRLSSPSPAAPWPGRRWSPRGTPARGPLPGTTSSMSGCSTALNSNRVKPLCLLA